MVRGRVLDLALGTKFRATEIPGLEPAAADGVVAEVTSNPKDPSMLGITNRSRAAWQATTADGKAHQIETDKTVRVADGTKIRFGRTDSAIQR
jgi:hypothetical protein